MHARTTDAIMKEVLEPITFVLAYHTIYIYIFPRSLNLTKTAVIAQNNSSIFQEVRSAGTKAIVSLQVYIKLRFDVIICNNGLIFLIELPEILTQFVWMTETEFRVKAVVTGYSSSLWYSARWQPRCRARWSV